MRVEDSWVQLGGVVRVVAGEPKLAVSVAIELRSLFPALHFTGLHSFLYYQYHHSSYCFT